MHRATLPILLAVLLVIIAIYYAIPGIYHPFTFSEAMEGHTKHAILFGGLAVLSLVWARFRLVGSNR